MSLAPYVTLYRIAGKPGISRGVFNGSVKYGADVIELIRDLRGQPTSAFEELLVNNVEIDTTDELPESWKSSKFTIQLPANSANTFHNTIADFISRAPQLTRGEMPEDFYIVSEDYYSGDGKKLEKIDNLAKICLLIQKISILALYHDTKASSAHKLIFLRPNDAGASHPVELITKIDEAMLEYRAPDVCLLDDLCSGSIRTDPHFNAKKGVFGVTLAEFLKGPHSNQTAFSYLICNWPEFLIQYQNNLSTYISGFAFHKAKREVAETELQIAERFSNVIGEITGKVLSIPISLVAVIAVVKSDSFIEGLFLVLGLVVASLIIAGAVRNQQLQMQRIVEAKNILFDSIGGRKDSYPEELRTAIVKMTSNLDKSERNLCVLLWGFRFLSWLPAFAGATIFLYNQSHLLSWWLSLQFTAFVSGFQYLL